MFLWLSAILTDSVNTSLLIWAALSVVCLTKKNKKKQAVLVTLSKLISFCLCVNSRKNSCHFSYSEDLDALTSVLFFFLSLSFPLSSHISPLCLFFCLTTEKCEGGNPVKADQLLPEMEEEVLQTQREDPLLCQRLQGTRMCETAYSCFKWSNCCKCNSVSCETKITSLKLYHSYYIL